MEMEREDQVGSCVAMIACLERSLHERDLVIEGLRGENESIRERYEAYQMQKERDSSKIKEELAMKRK